MSGTSQNMGHVATTPSVDASPTLTATDAEAQRKPLAARADSDTFSEKQHDAASHPLAVLGSARKNFLLFIFAVATFVDVCNISGVAIAVAEIGNDTGLGVSQLVWVSHIDGRQESR